MNKKVNDTGETGREGNLTQEQDASGREKPSGSENEAVCEKAPEWAEHHRFQDEDRPCDDGRSGKLDDK
jgi:hypothetical protein